MDIVQKIKEQVGLELKKFIGRFNSEPAKKAIKVIVLDSFLSLENVSPAGLAFEVADDPLNSKKVEVQPLNLYTFLLINSVNVPYDLVKDKDKWVDKWTVYSFDKVEMQGHAKAL